MYAAVPRPHGSPGSIDAPGTVRRIVGYARPYRGAIAVFLVLVVLDAFATAA
ncbi:MAG: hypothetical protein M3487_10015 [Actinomycetota bacterium]|nr:hypothetical protein [Acidimicrobiia bacterium]MDQ3470082.1 hypothetical protein [Actinomycetota bacterium]